MLLQAAQHAVQVIQQSQPTTPSGGSTPSFQDLIAQSGAITLAIQMLKKRIPALQTEGVGDLINRTLSVFLCAATTVGLSFHWDSVHGTMTFGGFETGVVWYAALAGMAWKIMGSITTVHLVYHAGVKNGMADKVAAAVAKLLPAKNP
jgi:hypothetical protein